MTGYLLIAENCKMKTDPFENWTYGDWANLKLFAPDVITPFPDLNEPETVPDEDEKKEETP